MGIKVKIKMHASAIPVKKIKHRVTEGTEEHREQKRDSTQRRKGAKTQRKERFNRI
jgi:hypothetical protein